MTKETTPAQAAKKKAQAARLTLFVRNILSVYYSASPAEIQAGEQWYNNAQAIATDLAATYSTPVEVVAGIIASTSPQKDWVGNVKLAEKLLATFLATGKSAVKQGGYLTLGLGKVDAILALAEPTTAGILPILNGLKIQAFYLNILGDENGVCVDGHAQNIALHGLKRVGITQAKAITPLTYELLARAYRQAAKKVGVSPAQCQAITWVAYKNLDFVKGKTSARAKPKKK